MHYLSLKFCMLEISLFLHSDSVSFYFIMPLDVSSMTYFIYDVTRLCCLCFGVFTKGENLFYVINHVLFFGFN